MSVIFFIAQTQSKIKKFSFHHFIVLFPFSPVNMNYLLTKDVLSISIYRYVTAGTDTFHVNHIRAANVRAMAAVQPLHCSFYFVRFAKTKKKVGKFIGSELALRFFNILHYISELEPNPDQKSICSAQNKVYRTSDRNRLSLLI